MFIYAFSLTGRWPVESEEDFRTVTRDWALLCMHMFGRKSIKVFAR